MKTHYILLIVFLVSIASCTTKNGDPGPTGATGATGQSASGTTKKQGSITGTLNYLDYKGSPINTSFSYEYYESLVDNEFIYNFGAQESPVERVNAAMGRYYKINFARTDLADSKNRFEFGLYGFLDENGGIISPKEGYIDFSYVGLVDGNVFSFNDYYYGEGQSDYIDFNSQSRNTKCDITNFSLDTLSGRLRFDYKTTYDHNSISYDDRYDNSSGATVTGSVDVLLNRKRASEYVEPQTFQVI